MRKTASKYIKAVFIIICIAISVAAVRHSVPAQETKEKVVRVGWYDSRFNIMDENGRRSGYAYEYQQKIAAYTGWTYEYVEESWPVLLEMLKNGEIDLLSDVSLTQERKSQMLFPTLPMGSESYYIFVRADNRELASGNYSALQGKKVGINKGSLQETIYRGWAKDNGIESEILELTGTENESVEMLMNGTMDAFVTLDYNGEVDSFIPTVKIGQSDFYFAVNKNREDLLKELNRALSRIQDEDRFYNQQMYNKYIQEAGVNALLSPEEVDWLSDHGSIKVGYPVGYLPFCDENDKDGSLSGALKEYLELARNSTRNAEIEFEPVAFPALNEALDAMMSGEIDCVFPVSLDTYDGEESGVIMTSPVMQAEVYAVIRRADRLDDRGKGRTAAVKTGDFNEDLFINKNYPGWNIKYYDEVKDCFKAVSKGEADCIFISNYSVALTENLKDKYKLQYITTGNTMDFYFAVEKKNSNLYSILDKSANLIPAALVDAALTANSYPDTRANLEQFVKDNIEIVLTLLLLMAALIVVPQVSRIRRRKKEMEEKLFFQEQLLTRERQSRRSDAMINAMAADYRSVYYVDLDDDIATCYRSNTVHEYGIEEGAVVTFSEYFSKYAQLYISETDREGFLEFIKPENIRERILKDTMISYRYLSIHNGEESYEMLRMADVRQVVDQKDNLIHAVGVGFTDVDKETRAELAKNRALSDALNQAEEANAAKTSFLSSMSHEIRTPMNAIIGFNTIALKNQDLAPETRNCLEKIGASARHLLSLINDILDMSRIESGRMSVRNEEFSFRDILEQINTMINGQCQDKGLKYECQVKGRVDDYYIGDDMKLKQVILNILGNSVKYTPEGGSVTFTVEEVARFEGNATLRFVMSDTGIGMDREFIPKMFSAFSQEDVAKANKYGSTGLGMAITKNIVEMMNGKIEVESEKGKGTTFTVTVTMKISDKIDHTDIEDMHIHDMRVLVIDDDRESCEHAQRVLDEVGIVSDVCCSGKEAYEIIRLAQARHQAYDLILVDWKMPEQDGIEVTRTIRQELDDKTAIIILTAYNWDDIIEEAIFAGVDSFIAKPLFATGVLTEFKKALHNNEQNREHTQKADLSGRKILVAEDMMINAEILKQLLTIHQMEVFHAENGQICVDMFKESEPGFYDAVLMDIRMPVMDGLQAAEAIRALDRDDAKKIPIIAMTANAFDEDVQRSLQAGMNAHLTKPVEANKLLDTLESMVS